MKKSTMVALAACLGILRMEAGNAFLDGFTLNDGRSPPRLSASPHT